MPSEKRLRMFAGPNGSGKSTFVNNFTKISSNIKLYTYINADDLEKEFKTNHCIDLNPILVNISTIETKDYFKKSNFSPLKLNQPNLWQSFEIVKNILYFNNSIDFNSYISADLAQFLRLKLVEAGKSFSFETVMSDTNKLQFLNDAKKAGYKIYLYYFATQDPEININRVQIRVAQNGHNVNSETIRSRYYRSLENLKDAILLSDRAYIYDNTDKSILISEITKGCELELIDEKNVPNWFVKYVYEK